MKISECNWKNPIIRIYSLINGLGIGDEFNYSSYRKFLDEEEEIYKKEALTTSDLNFNKWLMKKYLSVWRQDLTRGFIFKKEKDYGKNEKERKV